jgi:D-amino-acid dehydrogenase
MGGLPSSVWSGSHEVVLIERNSEVAAEASWGNAGMIAGSFLRLVVAQGADDSAEVAVSRTSGAAFQILGRSAAIRLVVAVSDGVDAGEGRRNTLLKHRLAAYSQSVLRETVADEAIEYNRSERGILYFHRDQQALDRGVEHMTLLGSDGQVIKVLDREGVAALEPSLAAAKSKIAGGIYCPTDETGESAKFARALAAKIVARGGAVHTGAMVTGLETAGDAIAQAVTNKGAFKGDGGYRGCFAHVTLRCMVRACVACASRWCRGGWQGPA